jgi:dTDP-glucose pyrophosphorylase
MEFEGKIIKANATIYDAFKIRAEAGTSLVVVDEDLKLLGTLSDGDLRKAILSKYNLSDNISRIFKKDPIFVDDNQHSTSNAKDKLIKNKIDMVPVVDSNRKLTNIIYLKDFLSEPVKEKIKIPLIVMAGGKGTRLAPFTDILPKPLIPVNGKTVIERIIGGFADFGIEDISLIVNFKSEILKAYFSELNPSYKVNFIIENKPLGTIGGVNLVNLKSNKSFFLTNCDVLINVNYSDLYTHHKNSKNDLTLVASTKQFTNPYGVCSLDTDGNLKGIAEKPSSESLVNTGLYVVNTSVLSLIPKNKPFNATDLIEELIKGKKRVGIYPIDETQWSDVGQWDEFRKTIEKN